MGAFSPSTKYVGAVRAQAEETIIRRTLSALQREGSDYRGVLYFGLMLTESGLKLLEYNARFGDPEAQAVLPRMKNDLLINLSPRKEGTSATLLNACKTHLDSYGHASTIIHLCPSLKDPQALFDAVAHADTLVFSGPCYINTYPADTIRMLQELAARPELLHGQNVYGMIQGGMPYAHTHASGLSMLQLFSDQCGLRYQGGFVMGMGAMLNGQPLSKLFNARTVLRQLNIFFGHLEKGDASPPAVYEAAQLRWSVFRYRLMSSVMNRMIDKDLVAHGIDIRQPSPYLSTE
jgi:hypothetical protein